MSDRSYKRLVSMLNAAIEPLTDRVDKYDSLLEKIGDSRFVLIGEATHGTHEFYQARNEITRQLISKKGFMAVAIEADWPAAYRVHHYLQGAASDSEDEISTLADFKRFPVWMWRNITIPPFLKWLKSYNDKLPDPKQKIGWYGLDLYSLYTSTQAVIEYLEKVDPLAAQQAKARYACFDHFQADPQLYGYLTTTGRKKSCAKEVIEQLLELQHNASRYWHQDGACAENYFCARQNARLVKDAEVYYRSIFGENHALAWNVRDTHMLETLNNIEDYLEQRRQQPAKIVVWAHNSHIGDARATEMTERGEINLGQLVREQHDMNAYLIGLSTYQGFVTAASAWDQPAQRNAINPGYESSYEELFHHLKHKDFLLDLRCNQQLEPFLKISRLQRAIGVVYRPESERFSHHYFTHLPYQFDSMIHFDQTTAVEPLEVNGQWRLNEANDNRK